MNVCAKNGIFLLYIVSSCICADELSSNIENSFQEVFTSSNGAVYQVDYRYNSEKDIHLSSETILQGSIVSEPFENNATIIEPFSVNEGEVGVFNDTGDYIIPDLVLDDSPVDDETEAEMFGVYIDPQVDTEIYAEEMEETTTDIGEFISLSRENDVARDINNQDILQDTGTFLDPDESNSY